MDPMDASVGRRLTSVFRWILAALAVAGAFAALRILPAHRYLLEFVEWVRGAGGLGMLAFAVA